MNYFLLPANPLTHYIPASMIQWLPGTDLHARNQVTDKYAEGLRAFLLAAFE